jgi:hypothetical protein
MLDIKINRKQEENILNQQEIIEVNNKNKISLRKNKNYLILQKRRENLIEHLKIDYSNIKPEFRFKIQNLKDSINNIFNCLNSNNKELISYCLNELRIYFSLNYLNSNDQKIIIERNLLDALLFFGIKFLEIKDNNNIEQILYILINIQSYQEGSNDYLIKLYTEPFFEFLYNCYMSIKIKDLFYLINLILLNMSINDENNKYNLLFLRSKIFSSILDTIKGKYDVCIKDEGIAINIIKYSVDLSSFEKFVEKKDTAIINRCIEILIEKIYGTKNEEILGPAYEGLFNISNLDNSYNFNKKLINKGATIKILKSKFYILNLNETNKKIIVNALRIISNNLTTSDKNCQIIYDLNIIDYYDKILAKFDDNYSILYAVFCGLANISVGKHKNIVKDSIIFSHQKIEKYCNSGQEILLLFIKIIRFLIYNSEYETLKFIFNTKILEYFLFLFNTNILSQFVYNKIIKVIDIYLKRFNQELKGSKEYLYIYYKFKDILEFSNKINNLDNQLISSVFKNIETNYQ